MLQILFLVSFFDSFFLSPVTGVCYYRVFEEAMNL